MRRRKREFPRHQLFATHRKRKRTRSEGDRVSKQPAPGEPGGGRPAYFPTGREPTERNPYQEELRAAD
ncbi:hypothetical protein OO015_06150 [Thermomicrobium sp. 4228-Ro]|uniref:hypothetical protein n=1 Tax=Thermomicrobium sp. 4228-Ro TaxID=2993937 RepID=UPI0022497F10|nr:hypothetical protein [Thermomicrobium sp. 4228-Ro]MCX2727077.1 hypothetical protein [Thermomicrobium sp. 4228-Ro]